MTFTHRRGLGTLLFAALLAAACNYTEGECWLRTEDDNQPGAGGGPLIPGQGGYGNVPPDPQGVDDPPIPDCNIVDDTPCNQKCLTSYATDADACTKIQDQGQRQSCNDNAYSKYTACKNTCASQANDCLEHCKDLCYEIMDKCKGDCKNAPNPVACRGKCSDEYGQCLKECEKKCKK